MLAGDIPIPLLFILGLGRSLLPLAPSGVGQAYFSRWMYSQKIAETRAQCAEVIFSLVGGMVCAMFPSNSHVKAQAPGPQNTVTCRDEYFKEVIKLK